MFCQLWFKELTSSGRFGDAELAGLKPTDRRAAAEGSSRDVPTQQQRFAVLDILCSDKSKLACPSLASSHRR